MQPASIDDLPTSCQDSWQVKEVEEMMRGEYMYSEMAMLLVVIEMHSVLYMRVTPLSPFLIEAPIPPDPALPCSPD